MRLLAFACCASLTLALGACSSTPAASNPASTQDASADIAEGDAPGHDGPSDDVASNDASTPGDAAAPDDAPAPNDAGADEPVSDSASSDTAADSPEDGPNDVSVDADGSAIWPDAHCREVVVGHNIDDPNRINLVFLYAGFDAPSAPLNVPHLFDSLVAGTTDNDYSFDPNIAPLYAVEGLAGLQPFQSNLGRFNFWYVDLPLYGAADLCSWLELPAGTTCAGNTLTTYDKDGNPVDAVLSPQDVLALSPAGRSCDLPNKYVHLVYAPTAEMDEGKFPAPGNYAVFGSYSQEILTFGATTPVSMVFQNFVHEFVHAVGQVWDEKGDNLSPADYPAAVPGPNCFSLGPAQQLTPAECAARDDLPWHDLIGNGCGKDGIVDCPVTRSYHDPNTNQDEVDRFDDWLYEVRDDVDGCGQGCLYAQGNIFRPYQGCNVMSSCDLTGEIKTGLFTRLGPVNEREVCRRILAITGTASAWCSTLCLAGCPSGQRCVQGNCVDKASIQ